MHTLKSLISVIKMSAALDRIGAEMDKKARPRRCPHGKPPETCPEPECVAKWVIET